MTLADYGHAAQMSQIGSLPGISSNRVAGWLTVAEYNNMGDLNPSAPQEPAVAVQRIEAGKVSAPLTENTRMITLFASRQGEFAVFHFDGNWKDGDLVPASAQWVPIAETYEITRITHMTADLRVAFR